MILYYDVEMLVVILYININPSVHAFYHWQSPIPSGSPTAIHNRKQRLEVRRAKASRGIPTNRSIPVSSRNNTSTRYRPIGLGIVAIATLRTPKSYVREALITIAVNPRVQETERGLPCPETSVVEKGDDASCDG